MADLKKIHKVIHDNFACEVVYKISDSELPFPRLLLYRYFFVLGNIFILFCELVAALWFLTPKVRENKNTDDNGKEGKKFQFFYFCRSQDIKDWINLVNPIPSLINIKPIDKK